MSESDEAAFLRMRKVATMKRESGELNKDVSETVQQRVLIVFEGHSASDGSLDGYAQVRAPSP